MFISKKQGLIERLVERFKLEAWIKEKLALSEIILLTTNVDDLLKTPKSAHVEIDISAAAGSYVAAHTVPSGKRWTILNIWRGATAAIGNLGVSISSVEARFGVRTASEMTQGSSFVLNEGDSVGAYTTGNGADTAIYHDIIYLEEDAF